MQNGKIGVTTENIFPIIKKFLYSDHEIFLRELVSNGVDATQKLKALASMGEFKGELGDLTVRVSLDTDKRILTISDSGIGMTAEEVDKYINQIAFSGAEEFMEKYKNQAIIGHFGLGFYSSFMVADKVDVTSRPAFGDDDSAATWTSDGLGTYTVAPAGDGAPQRGTRIVAHLKEDAAEFLEKFRVESVIRKHSAFAPFPVLVDGEQVNTQPALWREPKSSVTKEQYDAFYQALTYDSKAPLDVLHISVDAPVQFNALLYIPDARQDLFGLDRDFWGLDLYASRVLIQHRNKELIPDWLAFLKGVVDTEDLPLNISRETLQENVVLRKINQTIIKQALSHLEKLAAKDAGKYAAFWRLHGRIFKLSYQDFANRERIAGLLRFNTSALDDGEALSSLDEYMSRAPEGQKTFWYVSAPNREAARLSPHLERFTRKGIEVLFLYEPVDEFVMEGGETDGGA